MLRGDIPNLPQPLTMLSTTGSLSHETAEAIAVWIDAAIAAGLIVTSKDQYRTLKLTEQGWDLIHGRVLHPQIRRPTRMPARVVSRHTRRDVLRGVREPVMLHERPLRARARRPFDATNGRGPSRWPVDD
jgi:hypothetical protein